MQCRTMRRRQQRYVVMFFFLLSHSLAAQRVLYSSTIDRNAHHFTVAGKTGNFYWVHKEKRKRHISPRAEDWMKDEQYFDIYDTRLQLVNSIPASAITASTLKKYFIAGQQTFDEIILQENLQQTVARLRRYAPDGQLLLDTVVAQFPFKEPGYSFLLCSSADKRRHLLLGFESVPASAPRLHAMLFDAQWRTRSYQVYEQPFITQPFIQDDFFGFPSSADADPVQLANNGEWLMAAPSRSSNNFLLLHFDGISSNLSYKEIILPPMYRMEDVALSVNNEKGEAFAGVLSNYRQSARKNVQVTHYSFASHLFDFDSSYYFSTLAGNLASGNNLVRERFTAVPDLGFVLMKEYGRSTSSWYRNINTPVPWEAQWLPASNTSNSSAPGPFTPNGYTRYSNATAVATDYSRGDLSCFYFPGRATDSCWTGFINKKQLTELNAPTLSYLFVPLQDRLIFLYNSADREGDPFGCTLELDPQGNLLSDRELISWKADQSLRWQAARQITSTEVAVPYERNQQRGFAIFRF
ncbi:MAG TPA: hypothetical protein VL307_08695 [Chitinophagaceae bacterium]|nr:hypothetical protein [Chitinophagaceae bacterium]